MCAVTAIGGLLLTVGSAPPVAASPVDEPVGSIVADITRARAADGAPDPTDESTLGVLVADAVRAGATEVEPDVDLAVVSPTSFRADLLYEGDTSQDPANTDGVVTAQEAAAVLPAPDTISVVTLTGDQLKSLLEQPWRTDGDGAGFLQLALSDDATVTLDGSRPAGERVTSLRIGHPSYVVHPSQEYTVAAPSALVSGGDGFPAMTQGPARSTGLSLQDVWVDHLRDHPDLEPDFGRRQIRVTGFPDLLIGRPRGYPSDQWILRLGVARLNMTSAGDVQYRYLATGDPSWDENWSSFEGDGVDIRHVVHRLERGRGIIFSYDPFTDGDMDLYVSVPRRVWYTLGSRWTCEGRRSRTPVLRLTARNEGEKPLDLRLVTRWGTREKPAVPGGGVVRWSLRAARPRARGGTATLTTELDQGVETRHLLRKHRFDSVRCPR